MCNLCKIVFSIPIILFTRENHTVIYCLLYFYTQDLDIGKVRMRLGLEL